MQAPPALVPIGPIELAADGVDRDRPERLRRERDRRARHEPQPKAVLVGSQDDVAHHAAGPAARARRRGRCSRARSVTRPPMRLAERDREPRGRVDRAAPAIREARARRAAGTRRKNCASSFSNVAGRRSSSGPTRLPEVVDRVVAAPQDPVVGREPEVVELVVRVRQALAARPADRRALLRGQRLGHEHVVVDRHERATRAGAASPSRPTWRRRPGSPGSSRPPAVRTDTPPAPPLEARHPRPLVDAHAALARDARDAATRASPGRAGRRGPAAGRGRPARAGSGPRPATASRSRNSSVLAVLGRLVHPGPELLDLVGLVGQRQRARSPRGRSRCRARA